MRQLRNEPGLLGNLLALVGGVVLLVLGFMFSLVVLSIAAVVGLVVVAYFWWKTRALRQALREQVAAMNAAAPTDGAIIEGEAVVVEVSGRNALTEEAPRQ